ncbi:MAG: HD domain-containing protein [Anaeroplasma sp.]
MEIEFYNLISKIIHTPEYQTMKNHKHHINTNTYSHSIKVAYLCYKHGKKHRNKNLSSLVRGALLHDYYLYDWHDKDKKHRWHGYKHPRIAYKNALRDYPDLNKIEKDIILKHMFPLTIIPPFTKEGWIVCFFDKLAAISDYLHKNK